MYLFDVDNVVNKSVSSYLTDVLPPRISETTNYPLRNSEDFTIPSYRLTLTNSSFFSSTLHPWNSLELENINAPSYISSKRQPVRERPINLKGAGVCFFSKKKYSDSQCC
jgi:hypothetical protein